MMNKIVYSTDPAVMNGPAIEPIHREPSMREWMEEVRRTPRQCRDANNALNIEYRRRARAVGMTLESYCNRFNIKLK